MGRGAGMNAVKKKSAGSKDCPASDITVFGDEGFKGKSQTFEESADFVHSFVN